MHDTPTIPVIIRCRRYPPGIRTARTPRTHLCPHPGGAVVRMRLCRLHYPDHHRPQSQSAHAMLPHLSAGRYHGLARPADGRQQSQSHAGHNRPIEKPGSTRTPRAMCLDRRRCRRFFSTHGVWRSSHFPWVRRISTRKSMGGSWFVVP